MSAVSKPKWTRSIAWSAIGLICLSPFLVWMATVSDPLRYLRIQGLPPGQPLYVVAKLLGLLALCLFWTQCVLALARRAPMLAGFPSSDHPLHRRLGAATFVLIALHVGLFVVAASLRTGHFSWDLLLPSIGHGYYRTSVGLGAVALWLCALAVFAGARLGRQQRSTSKFARWKRMHMLWPLVFVLVFAHAMNIGTESRYGAMRYVVIALAASLAVAGISRAIGSYRARPGKEPPSGAQVSPLP